MSCSSRLVLGIDLAYIHPGYNNDAVPEYYDNARCRSLYQSDCAFGDTRYEIHGTAMTEKMSLGVIYPLSMLLLFVLHVVLKFTRMTI